jgi:hypothetical protein
MTSSKDLLSLNTGRVMQVASILLMVLWPVFVILGLEMPAPGNDLTLYLVMSIGAVLWVWAKLLVAAGHSLSVRVVIALPTAVAFGVLAAQRFYAFGNSPEIYQLLGALPLLEALLFTVLMALYLTRGSHERLLTLGNVPITFMGRLIQLWQSFRRLPLWVQIWVAVILVPVNMGGFFITDHRLGFWIALALISVLVANCTVLLTQARFSRIMSVPHIAPWGALQIYLLMGLLQQWWTGGLFVYAVVVFIINAVSLVFDAIDTYKWSQGDDGFV